MRKTDLYLIIRHFRPVSATYKMVSERRKGPTRDYLDQITSQIMGREDF